MTREQAESEYRKLLREWNDEEQRIMDEAKAAGILKPGLDSNRELFMETSEKFRKKIQELKDSLDK